MARSNYVTGILTFGLLATTSIVSPAKAETAKAATSWTINRVASAASGSYCTMAQGFSDKTILTFAKNSTGQYSLAFDFAKPQFPDAKATTVSLRPGNASAQTFSVSPTTDKVIVIGLGTGNSFVDALKTTGKLDLEANGKVFAFNTKDFGSSADELSNCIGTMKSPAIAAAAPQQEAPKVIASAAPKMISSPDVKSVQPMTSSGVELSGLQAENAQLKQALAQARQNYEAEQNNSQAAMASELQAKLDMAQRENQTLKALKSAPTDNSELNRIKTELATAQALNQSLSQQQQANQAAMQQLAAVQKENADVKAQLALASQTTAQLQAKAAQGATSGEQLAMLQKQNAEMKTQLDAATKNVTTLQAQNDQSAQALGQLSVLQKQNADMQAKLQASDATIAQLQTQAAQGTSAAQQVAILQKQSADLKTQLDASNANLAQLQTKAAQGASAEQQMASMQKQSADLKTQLDAANANIAQLQMKAAKGTSAEQQLAAIQKQSADMKVQLDAANSTVAQLQLKAAQGTTAEQQVAALQKQNADMKAQLDASVQNATQLQTKLAQMPTAPVVDQATVQENAALKQQVAQLQAAAAAKPAMTDNSQQISALQGENSALKQQLANIKNAAPVNVSSSDEVKNLESQLQVAQSENLNLKDQLTKLSTSTGAVSANGWDLEQATKRYQESQREIMRLGALVQKEQQQRKKDQDELDAKLFDPAITDKMQQEKLAQLQSRIAELEAQTPNGMTTSASNAQLAQVVPVPAVERPAPMQVASIAPASGVAEDKEVKAQPLIQAKTISKPNVPVASAVISPVASVNFQTPEDFSRMLKTAGINIRGDVESVATGASDSYRAYRWKTDSLFGSVEQRAMKGGKGFEAAVNDYLDRAKSRCEGDFAAVPSDVPVSGQGKSFEFACIGSKTNTSASVLFTYANDVMMTLAHEGKSEAMDLAMEARDRMASQMTNIKTASK